MLRACLFSIPLVFSVAVADAQRAPDRGAMPASVETLLDLVGMDESYVIMSEAGQRDAQQLEEDLFASSGAGAWQTIIADLYHPDELRAAFTSGFAFDRMDDDTLSDAISFWGSDLGQRIVEAELTAWDAMSDEEIEELANEIYFQRVADNDPRLPILERFTEVNDFVDLNVAGALNSNFAFYRGMADGGAYQFDMPQDMMLAEVMGQEPEIRENAILWLYSFQLMAYDNLSDADIEAYIAFSESEAGQTYNAAIFQGYDNVFETMSYRLGMAAAIFMTGDEL